MAASEGFSRRIEAYLEDLAVHNYSPRTITNSRSNLELFVRWCEERGIGRPEEVTRPILERYQRHLYRFRKPSGKALTFRTQRNRLTPVRGFFRWLAKRRYLLHNPASELELPKVPEQLPRDVLSASEAELVLNQAKVQEPLGVRNRAILETLYSTGMRRMELLGLSLYDVDAERGWVRIREGKGGRDRVVPIGERALAWIDRYVTDVRPGLVVHPEETTLFLTARGEPITPHRLSQMVHRTIEAAGLVKSGSCHLLRHTCATLMLENGADIRFIQQLLGHASLKTTQVYTQVSIAKLKEIHQATHPARLERTSAVAAELAGGKIDEDDDR